MSQAIKDDMDTEFRRGFEEAQRRIAAASREGAAALNLAGLSLSALPGSLGQLTNLKALY